VEGATVVPALIRNDRGQDEGCVFAIVMSVAYFVAGVVALVLATWVVRWAWETYPDLIMWLGRLRQTSGRP
jgi:hypothetical protein